MTLLLKTDKQRKSATFDNRKMVRRVLDGFRHQAILNRSRKVVTGQIKDCLSDWSGSAAFKVPYSVNLLTTDSSKIIKARKLGIGVQHVMYLAPAMTGVNTSLCSHATKACFLLCLEHAGKNGLSDSRNARRWRSFLLGKNPSLFGQLLALDISRAVKQGKRLGMPVSIRLDGTSDIGIGSALSDMLNSYSSASFREKYRCQFYDYTAVIDRIFEYPNSTCHLTFSYKGSNSRLIKRWFEIESKNRGGVAVVYAPGSEIPERDTIGGVNLPVVSYDSHDARYLDGTRKFFGALRFKHAIGASSRQRDRGFQAGISSGFLRVNR